jgi:hypothetical protein
MLALQLGMTVSELTLRMTAAEETAWIAYFKEDPFGPQRDDIRSAQIVQMVHNVNAPKGKARKLEDFLLFRKSPQEGDDPATIRKNFESLIQRQKR